jgi:RHS repeat-associated protein
MPGRFFNSSDYRFGFNGQESDTEIKGIGNSLDFGARIYDPRLGRFLSLDPLASSFPYYTPYLFAGNKPTKCTDFGGLGEEVRGTEKTITKTQPSQKTYTFKQLEEMLRDSKVSPSNVNLKVPSSGTMLNYLGTFITITSLEGCQTPEQYRADCERTNYLSYRANFETFRSLVHKVDPL